VPTERRLGIPTDLIGYRPLTLCECVKIDERGPRAVVAHVFHQFAEACARVGGELVAGMAQVVKVNAGQADSGNGRATQDEKALTPMGTKTASEVMQSIGIIQQGDPVLEQVAQPFTFPDEAEDARRVIAELNSTASRVAEVHVFGKGMGIAAPQIGVNRAAAIVQGPDGEAVTLLNPRVIEESPRQTNNTKVASASSTCEAWFPGPSSYTSSIRPLTVSAI
jgi:hypothetical protein